MSRSTITVVPLKTKNKETPEFAGDYVLEKLVLINHVGFKVDIKYLMIELNIYESIYKNAVTGSVVVTDEGNQIARMSIQGLEKLAFFLKTPGVSHGKEDVIDASEETGEPFHIYSITDRKQAIKTACLLASEGDIILIAGKGHETYQEIKGERKDFDDFKIVNEMLTHLEK